MSQSETAEFISKPILWPFRPMLPVKLRGPFDHRELRDAGRLGERRLARRLTREINNR
jgi:hypothetical protein